MFSMRIILFITLTYVVYAEDAPSVTTPLGKIQGHLRVSYEGNNYTAFEGIPFALPPVGDRRFKDPKPTGPWKNTLVANQFKTACWSLLTTINILDGSAIPEGGLPVGTEDCLYLNVYVPKKATQKKLPVVFYVYGGGFQYTTLGGDEQYYLIDHDVIFVSFNYRHGILGFLSTEDDIIPGNMGLKDQALALRWVSENIEYFGGDPKEITLYGWSSGAATVHYNYLSPMTAGLFKSGISFSGTVLNTWAQTKQARSKAIELGKLMGCPTNNISDMIVCLQKKPAKDVVAAQAKFMLWQFTPPVAFGPVVEKTSNNSFIDRHPIDIIRSGDIYDAPWITGVTTGEGLFPILAIASNTSSVPDLDKNWESIAPQLLNYYYTIPKDQHAAVARKIRQHYLGDEAITIENIVTLARLVGDRWFTSDAVKAVKEHAKATTASVRWYLYDYRATDSVTDKLTQSTKNYGTCHGDDVFMVLKSVFITPTKSAKDIAMQKALLDFWLSVARTGEPDLPAEWTSMSKTNNDFKYLHISGPGEFKIENNNDIGNLSFWESLGFNENKGSRCNSRRRKNVKRQRRLITEK